MKFYIWSFEHNKWWAPHSIGYTSNIDEAGIYTFEDATKICIGANIFEKNEAMLPIGENNFTRERE